MSVKSAAAAAALLILTGVAFAEPVPWSYRAPSNESYFPDGASGGLTFPNIGFQAGGSGVVAVPLAQWSIAKAGTPDRVSSLAYHFDLEFRDDLSGDTATMTFHGILTGSYWRTGADLTNTFTGTTRQTAELGGNLFTVSLTGFESPTGYGDELAGRITAGVEVGPVKGGGGGGGPNGPGGGGSVSTPEPATLLLAALGLPALGAMRAARRKRAA
jgi:hypothetical protein